MKCLENIVKTEVLKQTEHLSDQLQFAYRYGKGVDAILTILNLIHTHLEKENFYARILFFFFFSISVQLLLKKLLFDFELSPPFVMWLLDFLLERSQRERVSGCLPDTVCIFTGSPQGCVLSPLLFILYANDCRSCREKRFFFIVLRYCYSKPTALWLGWLRICRI